jgi:biotin carboxyl carrier protein
MDTYKVKSRGVEYTATVVDKVTGGGTVTIEDREFQVAFTGSEARRAKSQLPVMPVIGSTSAPIAEIGDGSIVAPISGVVVSIHVKVGDSVSVDQVVLKLEAMKMENEITAPVSGIVKEIAVSEGSEPSTDQLLMTIG